MEQHVGSILPIKNRVIEVDGHTSFLAHYDINANDVLQGIEPVGEKEAVVFNTTSIKANGAQYAISSTLTMTAWVYPTAVPTNGDRGAIIIGKGTGGGYYFTIDTSYKLAAYWHGKSPAGYHTSTGTCPLNKWTHIAVTWGTSELKLYINGVLDKTIAVTGTGVAPPSLDIGSENTLNRNFKGRLNHLGIWAEEKSIEEVNSIMLNGMRNNERNLRAFWKMNEGQGSTLRDSSSFSGDITHEANKGFSWDQGQQVYTLKEEGRFGGGIAVEEETINVFTNPNFSSFGGYTGLTATQITEPESLTGKALHLKATGPSINAAARIAPSKSTLSATNNYTMSFYAKGFDSTIGRSPRVYTGNKWVTIPGELTDKYKRFVVQSELYTSGGASIGITSLVDNDEWYIHSPQLEEKIFATSFVEGSRPKSSLKYPKELINPAVFTFSAWAKLNVMPSMAGLPPSGLVPIFEISNGIQGTNRLLFGWLGSNELVTWKSTLNPAENRGVRTGFMFNDTDIGVWRFYATTFDGTTCKVYVDGVLVGSSTMPQATYHASSSLCIGGSLHGILNGMIDEVRIDEVARTEDEINSWYYSNSPFYPRGIYRKSY